jgi:hypothetical protein
LAVNDLTRVTAGGVMAVKAFKSLSLGRTFISCQVERSLQLGVLSEIRDFDIFENIILSVGVPVGNTPKCPFSVGLESAELN